MYTSTISSKGQITIPAKIRKQLGLNPNDKVALIFRGNEIILKPIKGTIKDLRGSIAPRKTRKILKKSENR
ncbi:MAG: AbrB/MazE/SpoVT family DNA-binding domain-containing protein [Calditrichaeota bacterium]|nr:MAG: AbrB/MazE/SpoVT family DNA-binding domain-containing protein [Calditrichota bacterium]